MNSSATVSLDTDGSATVVTGNPDIGGTRVAQALMVSEELGIPVERVRPVVADTDTAGYTDLTAGSRVCYATGMAIIRAAAGRARAAAAARGQDLEARGRPGGVGERPRADRSSTGDDQAAAQRSTSWPPRWPRPADRSSAARRSTRRRPDPRLRRNICDLEVDPETGRSTVVRYTADAGRRQGRASELRRGADAGRRRPGHRLGAQRGVRLQRRRASCRTPGSSTTACRSRRICR